MDGSVCRLYPLVAVNELIGKNLQESPQTRMSEGSHSWAVAMYCRHAIAWIGCDAGCKLGARTGQEDAPRQSASSFLKLRITLLTRD